MGLGEQRVAPSRLRVTNKRNGGFRKKENSKNKNSGLRLSYAMYILQALISDGGSLTPKPKIFFGESVVVVGRKNRQKGKKEEWRMTKPARWVL